MRGALLFGLALAMLLVSHLLFAVQVEIHSDESRWLIDRMLGLVGTALDIGALGIAFHCGKGTTCPAS